MNTRTKQKLIALVASGALVGGSLVGAQAVQNAQSGGAQSGGAQTTPLQTPPAQTAPGQTAPGGLKSGRFGLDGHGFGNDFGLRGAGFGRLALGTTVQVTFYDGDPAAGGTVTDTLSFIYGQDSEAAFAQSLDTARQNAAYMTVDIGEQSRTVDLSTVTMPTNGRGLLPRELARGLDDGSTITATFYDGDPAANGQVTDTLTFTYGTDSEAGFADNFSTAAANAAFVAVTTSPQTYMVDLSQVQAQRQDGFGGRVFEGRRGHR